MKEVDLGTNCPKSHLLVFWSLLLLFYSFPATYHFWREVYFLLSFLTPRTSTSASSLPHTAQAFLVGVVSRSTFTVVNLISHPFLPLSMLSGFLSLFFYGPKWKTSYRRQKSKKTSEVLMLWYYLLCCVMELPLWLRPAMHSFWYK